MRIACLQFAPQLGDVDNNLSRADAILERADPKDLDLLVLPELAFSGYNFKSLNHISPYLEFNGKGISSLWARTIALKHDCTVSVGYPESVDITDKWPADPEYYSSTVTYGPDGDQLANYRKAFLYHVDETWALEGQDGFFHGDIPGLGKVAMGICMDLKFEAPWHAWEFANHILSKESNLVVLSMAWLMGVDEQSPSQDRDPKEPDMATLAYWLSRLEPLMRSEMEGEIIVVFANRCGTEDKATYAGTSAVIGVEAGEVKLYGILGHGENELLVVDTSEEPIAKLVTEPSSSLPEVSDRNRDASGSTTSIPVEEEHPASIDAILAASKPISPVEPHFQHAYYAPEPPKDKDVRHIYSSSGNLHDVVPNIDSLTVPNGVVRSNRSSMQSTISSSIQSSIPTSALSVSPTADYSAVTSSLPSTNRPASHKTDSRKGTPQRVDPVTEAETRNKMVNSLVIPAASLNLGPASEDCAEPTSASSMTTNTPWDKHPPFPFEEKAGARKSSPPVRNASPFIAALQQSTAQSQRTRTSASKSPQLIQPEPEQQKPSTTALGIYKETELDPSTVLASDVKAASGPSRHPTADPTSVKPPSRGLLPPDNSSSALSRHSTGW